MTLGKAKPTIRSVAKAAEVSPTTVWMVIHDTPGVAPETIQRVWTTITERTP